MRTRHEFVGCMRVPAVEGGSQLAGINNSRPNFADDDSSPDIGEASRFGHASAGSQRHRYSSGDRVTGPGDIVDLAHYGPVDIMNGVIGRDEHGTLRAERNQDGPEPARLNQRARSSHAFFFGGN